jgi:hypothetical protein
MRQGNDRMKCRSFRNFTNRAVTVSSFNGVATDGRPVELMRVDKSCEWNTLTTCRNSTRQNHEIFRIPENSA